MILFFDTETTGLPKNWKAPVIDLDNWPRLVQLAYLVYDFDGNLIHSGNEIIKPNGFTIPTEASKVHGITTDIANQRGSNIAEVFELFSIHLKRAKVVVAHNMAYDEKIIGSELIRLGFENTVDSKEKICTMISTVDLCKIDGPYGYKWPKLEELHRFLFKHDFEGAHDALADIQATAKCFWELKKRGIIHLFGKQNGISNRAMTLIKEVVLLEENKNFDVPFLIIDQDGIESWTLFNTKLDIKHHPFEDHEISEVMSLRIPGDENLWENIIYYTSILEDVTISPLFNEEGLWTEKWQNWEINPSGELYYRGEIILDIPKLFTIGLIGLNQKMNKVRGFKFFNSDKNISKVIAHYRNSSFSGLFGDGEETVFEEYYFTLFYIDQNGSIFLENKQLVFDSDSCVPFLKIDAEGNSSWQFYDYKNNIFFGKIFEDHRKLEREIQAFLIEKTTYLWKTEYYKENIGLNEWNDWVIKDGNLSFRGNLPVNIFEINLTYSYSDLRDPLILNSDSCISKIIIHGYDADHEGVNFDGYSTLFYIDDTGRIFIENNIPKSKEFDIFDAWEAIADYEAEKNFQDDDIPF
jgi:DNA polymerase III epsilon subunit-like protein